MSFIDKIDDFRHQHNMGPTRFEREAGLPKGSLNKWRNGTRPRIDSLQRAADYMKMPLKDLMSTDAADIYGSPDSWSDGPDVVRDSALRYIPVYRSLEPGKHDTAPEDIAMHLAVLPDNTPDADNCYGYMISDSSMAPYIEPGDIVIIRADEEPSSGSIVVVYAPGSGIMCRKLVRAGHNIILQPFSRHWNATVYRNEELDFLQVSFRGEVIDIIRNVSSSADSVPEL